MPAPRLPALEEELPPFDCTLCGSRKEGEKPDDAGRCASCRGHLIRRSGAWALLPALVVAAGYLWLVFAFELIESPAMIFFLALGAGLSFAAYKVGRRVAFDMLVTRGTAARKP